MLAKQRFSSYAGGNQTYPEFNSRLCHMFCRGVRGATTVAANDREEILTATRQLLALMVRRNGIEKQDVASAIFTTTPDLDAEFPALAARQLGWLDVPLLCGHELSVPGSLAALHSRAWCIGTPSGGRTKSSTSTSATPCVCGPICRSCRR